VVLEALTSTAFGAGVMVGLLLGALPSPVLMPVETLVRSSEKRGHQHFGRR
jgi:hypothetical protein